MNKHTRDLMKQSKKALAWFDRETRDILRASGIEDDGKPSQTYETEHGYGVNRINLGALRRAIAKAERA